MKHLMQWFKDVFLKQQEIVPVSLDALSCWCLLDDSTGYGVRHRFQRTLLAYLKEHHGFMPRVRWEAFLAVWEVAGSMDDGDWWAGKIDATFREILHAVVTNENLREKQIPHHLKKLIQLFF